MKTKKVLGVILCVLFAMGMLGCGAKQTKDIDTLNIAYQYGLGYAPATICQQEKLIEKQYKENTGKDVQIIWTQMNSGADINTGIASGDIDVGFMGVSVAITGVSQNVGYKIFTNLVGQKMGLMVNNKEITSLGDLIGSEQQIAVPGIGSIQHLVLAKALYTNGYDAHALDSNLVAMKHPDAMAALESGTVTAHMSCNPYVFMEEENENIVEVREIEEIWPIQNTFLVGIASEELHTDNNELYMAMCDAFSEAMELVNDDVVAAAKITAEFDGNELEVEQAYLQKSVYTTETSGVFELAQFMYENKFIENKVEAYEDLVFDNVKGD